MDKHATKNGSATLSDENENELIKLAGLLNTDEWEAVRHYLKSLQSDVDNKVIQRIVDFSKNYNEKSHSKEKVTY